MTSYPPKHISYSQLNSYKRCPRSWYLGKLRKAEEKQAWFIAVGNTVHKGVEHKLKTGAEPNITALFYAEVRKQMLIEPDLSKWLSGGPKADPIVGGKALQMALDCYERALEFLDDLDVWEVEYNASGRLPGLQVELKAFVDIIGEYRGKKHKKYQGPMIVDWKTGSTKPDNFQLQTYAALFKVLKDDTFRGVGSKFSGRYAMLAPQASNARPIDLSEVDPAAVGAEYQRVYDQMVSMQIQAKPGKFDCAYCFHQPNCLGRYGSEHELPDDRQRYYDLSKQDHPPF